jgi:hypothetical protein
MLSAMSYAQSPTLQATRIQKPIRLDGNLDDPSWQQVTPVTEFVQSFPTFGVPAPMRTEVRIAYDDVAVYIGAYLYGSAKQIRRQLTQRDVLDFQDTDLFSVGLDTYLDRQNAFIFQVSAAGVQGDSRQSQTENDRTWDAVWESKTSIKADGWVVEMLIPLSAIRFARKPLQDWGIQFRRFDRTINQSFTWSPENPAINGSINQWGMWQGLKDIRPPLRLSFLPYVSGGVRVSPVGTGYITEPLRSGGMDVKYGIDESFTLDATLIPDFAQVQSDNVFLNLSPFQVKFEDFRPFFTEGTELFNKADLFYSRRIGAEPTGAFRVLNKYGNDTNFLIRKNPGITRLFNATKFSGRTKKKLGIGVLNAVGQPMQAVVFNKQTGRDSTIKTEPLANYNIVVLDQALRGRSSVTFTNTNVIRADGSRNANVSAIDLALFDTANVHRLFVQGRVSQIWGKHDDYGGFAGSASYAKVSGMFQYEVGMNVESDKYDPNDLGFLQNNNSLRYSARVSYNFFNPTKHYLQHRYSLTIQNRHLYNPFSWSEFKVSGNAFFWFKNFWDVSIVSEAVPFWTRDFFEPRVPGRVFRGVPYWYVGINGSSDSRKPWYLSWNIGGAESPVRDDPYWTGNLGFRYRFSPRLQSSINFEIEQDRGNRGFAFFDAQTREPVFVSRNIKQNTLVWNGQYNFTPRMNLTIRLRHYWSYVNNRRFFRLLDDGWLAERPFINNTNRNFNTFNIDMFYTWDFIWGSRLTLAWKNALGSNVFLDPLRFKTYTRNFAEMFRSPHSNEISLKVVYFLDYLHLQRRRQ